MSAINNIDPDYNFYEHILVAPPNAAKMAASAFRSGPGSSLSIWIKTDTTTRNIDGLLSMKNEVEQLGNAAKIADYVPLQLTPEYFIDTRDGSKKKYTASSPGTQYAMLSAECGDTFYVTGNGGSYLGIAFFNSTDAISSSSP